MTAEVTTHSGRPKGWLAACIGGVLGILVGGALGIGGGILYVDLYQDGGLEDLFTVFIGLLVGGYAGAAVGTALAVKARRHEAPMASGLLFATIGALILAACGAIAGLGGSWPVTDALAIGIAVLTPVSAAILARKIVLAKS